ncbi:MAG TPA: hypothetical protein VLF91_00650 [Candidatus Saccharimonadales bacterium]|nr:hypothetical protein [Candidatus Saccharimonadales bacterium]
MQRSVTTLTAIVAVACGLVLAPLMSGTALAAGCHHNEVTPSQWGAPFDWTASDGTFNGPLFPSQLMFAGDSSSTCHDINIRYAHDTASQCGYFITVWIQYYNPAGHNYFGMMPDPGDPATILVGDPTGLYTAYPNVPNGQGYRIVVEENGFNDDICDPRYDRLDVPILD